MKLRLRRFAFPALILLIVLAMSGLLVWNQVAINELASQGKQPVSVLPTAAPSKGDRGEKGDTPSAEEIAKAVANYCAATGLCEGDVPSQATVFAAVSQYCSENRCKGDDGAAASEVTPAQIQAQVVAYCATNNCRGADGKDAVQLPPLNGTDGADAPKTILACVERTTNSLPTRYIAWRYENETGTAYRDLYKLPVWAECVDPVNLRSA